MPESQSSLPERLKKIRNVATVLFVLLTAASYFVPLEGDTFFVFLLFPTMLLILARRLHVALAIEFSALALWITRRLFLEGPPPAGQVDDFLFVYVGTVVGVLLAFQLADFVSAWWQRMLGDARNPAETGVVPPATIDVSASSVLVTLTLFFVLSSWAIDYANLQHETLLVFGLAPAVLCAMAGIGWMRLRTILVIELVLVAIWLVRVLYFADFEPHHVDLFSALYYVAAAATLIAVKLFDLGMNLWKRANDRGASRAQTEGKQGSPRAEPRRPVNERLPAERT